MTEVPEYLLERSRARRAALGLPNSGGAPGAAVPSSPGEEGGGGTAGTPAVVAAPSTPSLERAAAAVPAAAPVEDLPAYVREPGRRTGIPAWMMPVLILLPLWGIMYLGAFGETSTAGSGEISGAQIYSQRCAVCHAARGGGGVGPKLAGEVTLTFSAEADHIAFVAAGSAAIKGQPYGDPARPGGQHIARSGGMPPFGESLSPEELAAVVKFEREGL